MYVHVLVSACTVSAVVEVVPHLSAVLARMITQLGAIKHENMQWVFSYSELVHVHVHVNVHVHVYTPITSRHAHKQNELSLSG